MTLVFTDTLLNIFSKHISNKTITCNDKDAPWITPQVKSSIRRNSRVYRKWVNRGRNPTEHSTVREVQNSTSKLILEAKRAYFEKLGDELSNPQTGQKRFWTAFKRISNKKKITNIPPLIDNETYITNFQQKAKVFNDYFADQCTNHENDSILPDFSSKTDSSLSHVDVNIDKILILFKSIAQIRQTVVMKYPLLCLKYVLLKLLSLIYQSCLATGTFPESWKCANVQPIHKKNNRQFKSNYRPI